VKNSKPAKINITNKFDDSSSDIDSISDDIKKHHAYSSGTSPEDNHAGLGVELKVKDQS
jgi:hypothetical protein